MVPRPQANSSFFVLHSSFTKANIEPFTRAAKNRVSVTSKNLLTKSRFRVNKNNALIFNAKTDVFVRRKRRFPFCGAARAFLRLYELRSGREAVCTGLRVCVLRTGVYPVSKASVGSGKIGGNGLYEALRVTIVTNYN